MRRFVVQRYSEALCQYALLQSQPVSVHSVFQTGANIRLGERLIYLGSDASAMRPFGMAMRQEALQPFLAQCRQGAQGRYDKAKSCMTWEWGAVLDFSQAFTWNGSLPPGAAQQTRLAASLVEIQQYMMDHPLPYGLSQEFLTEQELLTAFRALISSDKAEVFGQLDHWMGRGPGLTPSGDDMLVGLMAALRWGGEEAFCANVADYTLQKGKNRTTAVSCEYIFYAGQGVFSQEICALLASISQGKDWQHALWALLSLGHSSGVDTALGLMAGLEWLAFRA